MKRAHPVAVFSYVFMKCLERRARWYDSGLAWLTLGRSRGLKRRIVAEHVSSGVRMLDVGTGTGTLAVLAAQRGARVVGFDLSPEMLREARRRVGQAGLADRIDLREMGVGRMDELPDGSFDLVTAVLVLSELTEAERRYTLKHSRRVLRGGGKLVVVDETWPRQHLLRLLHAAVHYPMAALTWLVAGATTTPLADLEGDLRAAGFTVFNADRSLMGSLVYCVAYRK